MKARVILLLGVLGVSFSAIFVKYASAPSITLAFYRMLFVTILLLPAALLRNRGELSRLKAKDALMCAASGFFLACHFSCYFESIRQTSVASSTVLVDTEVFFVAVFSFLLFREKSTAMGYLGMVITFLGSVLLALADSSGGSGSLYGDLLALAGALFVSIYTMLGARIRRNLSTTVYTLLAYGTACVTLLCFSLISSAGITGYGGMNWLLGFLLAVVCTLGGHSVFNWCLKYLPTALVSDAKLGEPVFATVLTALLFGQIPTLMQLIGMAIVISGILLYLNCSKNTENTGSVRKSPHENDA